MSNKRAHNKRAAIERAAYGGYTGSMGIQGDYSKYAGGNSVTIPANVLAAMLQNMAPQKNQAKDFAPGSPLAPYEGVVPKSGPRVFAYPVGININANDRTLGNPDVPGFAQLRNFAMLYSGITLCERVILDMIPKLVPQVSIRKELAKAGVKEKAYKTEISQWMKFIEMPDPQQRMDIHTWLRMAWTETTQIDALSLFKQKDRGGRLLGLNIIAGDTMKPILDERGMIPQPPWPAYQQYPYGVPGDQYNLNQVVYYRESPRSFTPYGLSRVERIILEVNQALRKKQRDLSRYTEGNVPAGIMEVPDTSQWTPDQIDAYEMAWNSLLAGNAQQQVRIRFTQPGMKYTAFADPTTSDSMTEFDEFLLNVAAACYGLSMGDLAFTASIHKSADEGQQNMMFRRTLDPMVSTYARILTNIMRENTDCDVLEYDFAGFTEAEDILSQSTAYGGFVDRGVLSRAAAARLMNFPEIPETGPFILQQGGPPIFLDDLANPAVRKAQQAAQMAGLQMAATAPTTPQSGGKAAGSGSASAQGGKSTAGTGQTGGKQGASGGADAGDDDLEQGLDEAEQSLSTLGSGSSTKRSATLVEQQIAELLERIEAIERTDAVRGPGGEFGYSATPKQSTGHKASTTKKGAAKAKSTKPKMSQKDRLTSHAQKLAARFEKLGSRKLGAKWSAAQQQAADKLGDIFSQLAESISGGKAGNTDKLLDAAYEQAKVVFAGNPKGMNAMAHSLTLIDAANDKGIRAAIPDLVDEVDDEDEFGLDELEQELDRLDEGDINEQGAQSYTESEAFGTGDARRGDSESSRRGTAEDGRQLAAPGDSRTKAVSEDYRRWKERAIADVKAGRTQRAFTSTLIPGIEQAVIYRDLAGCKSVDEVRGVFEYARKCFERIEERDTSPKVMASVSGGNLQPNNSTWNLRW
jgi:hypothetical protein